MYGPDEAGILGRYSGSGCYTGTIRTGGAYRQHGDVLLFTPDQAPGVTYTLDVFPDDRATDQVQAILNARGSTGRVALSGNLLSDDTVLVAGWGTLGPNEVWDEAPYGDAVAWRGGNVVWGAPPFSHFYMGDIASCPGEHPLADTATATGGTVQEEGEPPPEPWTGEQVATVRVDGAGRPENVTVIGEDGNGYGLASTSDATRATELATTAPQGTRLVVTGTWDPDGGLVEVTDWYIQELGEGERKYGITPEGDLGPQSPEYPSTDWPGGQPPDQEAAGSGSGAGAEAETPPTEARTGLVLGLGLLAAALVAYKAREER